MSHRRHIAADARTSPVCATCQVPGEPVARCGQCELCADALMLPAPARRAPKFDREVSELVRRVIVSIGESHRAALDVPSLKSVDTLAEELDRGSIELRQWLVGRKARPPSGQSVGA